jgi:hypothetical protein
MLNRQNQKTYFFRDSFSKKPIVLLYIGLIRCNLPFLPRQKLYFIGRKNTVLTWERNQLLLLRSSAS